MIRNAVAICTAHRLHTDLHHAYLRRAEVQTHRNRLCMKLVKIVNVYALCYI